MRLRTQLALVFLLLAVLPLGGIVLYSYFTSQRALRSAVEIEAELMTAEMESRMQAVQADLGRRVERLGTLPLYDFVTDVAPSPAGGRTELGRRVLEELGDAASLVQSFEFTPAPTAEQQGAADPRPESAAAAVAEAGPEAGAVPPGEAPAVSFDEAFRVDFSEMESFRIEMAEIQEEIEREIAASIPEELGRDAVIASARVGLEMAEKVVGQVRRQVGGEAEAARPPASGPGPTPEPPVVTQARDWEFHFDHSLSAPVFAPEGEMVGALRAQVSTGRLLGDVLARTRRDQGEKPFAIDPEGNLYTATEEDRNALSGLDLGHGEPGDADSVDNWVVVQRRDPATGLTFGLARPIGDSLSDVRSAAARNFAYGLALVALAMLGIVPLSARLTRDLGLVTASAQRVAEGDLEARVPVRSSNEVGELATAFNRMAEDLSDQRSRLISEERQRLDQKVETELLRAEVRRKTEELEEARHFQLSMLPRELPHGEGFEVAVSMRTATEVGGDYYDFRQPSRGELVVAVGDATGHGARAGTMVTVTKSLFSVLPHEASPASFLTEASQAIRAMELGRMAMALTVVRIRPGELAVATAGMPPALLHRSRANAVEEISLPGVPLGSMQATYDEKRLTVDTGDTLLLLSDGLPELVGPQERVFGYHRASETFAAHVGLSLDGLIAELNRAADGWRADQPMTDDVTFVAVRFT